MGTTVSTLRATTLSYKARVRRATTTTSSTRYTVSSVPEPHVTGFRAIMRELALLYKRCYLWRVVCFSINMPRSEPDALLSVESSCAQATLVSPLNPEREACLKSYTQECPESCFCPEIRPLICALVSLRISAVIYPVIGRQGMAGRGIAVVAVLSLSTFQRWGSNTKVPKA